MMDVMDVEMTTTTPSPIRAAVIALHRRQPLIDTLQLAGDQPRIFWQNGQLTTAYAGWGVTATLTTSGPDRFARLRAEVETLLACVDVEGVPRDAAPRMFGGFAFRDDYVPHQTWRCFPNTYFVLPRVMITDTDGQLWLTVTGCDPQEDLDQEAARIASQLEQLTPMPDSTAANVVETSYPLTREAWRNGVNEAVQRINDGELQKVVLSRTGDLRFDRPVDVVPVLEKLSQRYPSTYRFLFEPQQGSAFMGATPELLIEVADQRVRTAAVAGSIGRGADEREDAALATALFTSPKERHEHGLVADALRDLLAPMTSQLNSPDVPQILKLGNIQHLYTPFDGVLCSNLDVLDAVEKLHPTPALGGCPQTAAMAAIREIETVDRGWFASPVGWIDGCGNGMLAVAIRSAVIDGDSARLYAGCGIVAQSHPDSEWDETRIKFRPMLDALGAEGAL